MHKVLIIIILGFLFISASYAMESEPVITDQAQVSLVSGGYDESGNVSLGLHYELSPGWQVYWRSAGDTGYPPSLDWQGSKNIKSTEMFWPAPSRSRYKLAEDFYTESYGYHDEVLFPIEIAASDSSKDMSIKLHVEYAICKEICIPDQADLSLTIQAGYFSAKTMGLISSYQAKVPKENGSYGIDIADISVENSGNGKNLRVVVNSKDSLAGASMFIEGGENFAFYNPVLIKDDGRYAFNAPISFLTDKETLNDESFIITLVSGDNAVEKHIAGSDIKVTTSVEVVAEIYQYTLIIILLFAFIGGLILNVMPCVLPVLSIKLMDVIKHGGGSKSDVAVSFIVTALGIVTSFVALALLVVGLRQIGINVGWGFHFQEPLFIIFLVVILTLFAANMWGLYEFRLPINIGGAAYKKSEKHNLLGHFLTGVFVTILATPCTAPFIGTAVGFAMSRGYVEIIATLTAMGLGMATPYVIFSIFPRLVTMLPKPGKWMLTVKNIMGWFLAITAIWLIWVLSNQIGVLSGLTLLAISIIKLMKFRAAGRIKFLARESVRITLLVIIIILAFVLPMWVAEDVSKNTGEGDEGWISFEPSKIDALVQDGNIVFIDVTADWCLTCKVNKLFVLGSKDIKGAFAEYKVVAMRADWTNKDDEVADYLMSHGRVGIPFNVIYAPDSPDGIILPELLTKSSILSVLKGAGKNNSKNN